jgi:hypothetical protein
VKTLVSITQKKGVNSAPDMFYTCVHFKDKLKSTALRTCLQDENRAPTIIINLEWGEVEFK